MDDDVTAPPLPPDNPMVGFQAMAASIASAITDGMAAANDSSSSSALSAKIDRTHPALIDPRKHGNDAHKFGLLLKRMIEIDYSSAGLAGIAWKHSFKAKSLEIQNLVHAESSQSSYIEGESEFIALINQCLGLAIEHDKNAASYATLRTRQLAWWFDAFNTIKQDLRHSTRFWKTSSQTFRLQMEDLICTALGLGFSAAQLRSMKTTLKLRSDFHGGDSDDDAPRSSRLPSSFASPTSLTSPPLRPRPRDTEFDSSDPAIKRQRTTPPNSDPAKKFTGTRMAISKSIVGASTQGAKDCDFTCEVCGVGGTVETGHRKFECPKLFGTEHPGRSMPGFSKTGERVPSAWDGPNITAATKSQWVRLQSLGFFSQPPFRKNPDSVPVMRG